MDEFTSFEQKMKEKFNFNIQSLTWTATKCTPTSNFNFMINGSLYLFAYYGHLCRSGRYVLQVIIFNILNIIMFMEWKTALVSITNYTGILKLFLHIHFLKNLVLRKHFYFENRFLFQNNVLFLELL